MILRFRSKVGTTRVSVDPGAAFTAAVADVCATAGFSPDAVHLSNSPADGGKPLAAFGSASVASLGYANGDMVYVSVAAGAAPDTATAPAPATAAAGEHRAAAQQLPVDDLLDAASGYIKRPPSSLCRHGGKGMCEYCAPVPPWDKDYLAEHGIKHKSFHAHVKEMDESTNSRASGSSYIAPVGEPSYAVDRRCGGHAPYPKGICSKCQPAPITLQQQKFRMVDHLEYADHAVLNKFLDTWRRTGVQRYGVLYGRYEPYDQVPLGVKAVVEAIYEPPQASELDGITLLDWDNEPVVDLVARAVGLYKVGVVFTDLTDAGKGDGSVLCKRHKDSFFLSCVETLMAARLQAQHPNATKHAASRQYSSKFVTCVVTGGLEGEIEPRAYQVSASAEALVKADVISASTHPNMVFIKPTDGSRYVPDVFYSKINEYGLEVKENAKPAFPVDFLLVSLSDSFPATPDPMFISDFPIEARDFVGDLQNSKAVRQHLQSGAGDMSRLRDFHFLVYLCNMEVLSNDERSLLLRCVKNGSEEDYAQLVQTSGWMTLLTILDHSV